MRTREERSLKEKLQEVMAQKLEQSTQLIEDQKGIARPDRRERISFLRKIDKLNRQIKRIASTIDIL